MTAGDRDQLDLDWAAGLVCSEASLAARPDEGGKVNLGEAEVLVLPSTKPTGLEDVLPAAEPLHLRPAPQAADVAGGETGTGGKIGETTTAPAPKSEPGADAACPSPGHTAGSGTKQQPSKEVAKLVQDAFSEQIGELQRLIQESCRRTATHLAEHLELHVDADAIVMREATHDRSDAIVMREATHDRSTWRVHSRLQFDQAADLPGAVSEEPPLPASALHCGGTKQHSKQSLGRVRASDVLSIVPTAAPPKQTKPCRVGSVDTATDCNAMSVKKSRSAQRGLGFQTGAMASASAHKHHKAEQSVFADAEAMKQKLRATMAANPYNVSNFYKPDGLCQKIARSAWFDNFTLFIISVNALWISIDTDRNKAATVYETDAIFLFMDNFFCCYYNVELLIRFMAFEHKTNCFRDAWFVFDTVLVVLMILDTWIMTCVQLSLGGSSSGEDLGDLTALRMLRLARLTRLARMAKLLRAMPELMILVKGIMVACRSVFFTLCLFTLIMYVFGIAFTQLMEDSEIGKQYFPTVPEAMNSLLLFGTLPDQERIVTDVGSTHWVFRILILLYILLASLTVMNMLIGVLCEVVSVVSEVEKEQLLLAWVRNELLQMIESSGLDADGDAKIDRREFENLLTLPAAYTALQEVGVDLLALVDLTSYLFEDKDSITFGEFMDIVLQFRGSNKATVKDVVDLRRLVMAELKLVNSTLSSVWSAVCDGTSEMGDTL
eukprot:TRINITY_DN7799_c0_g5_i1.p1 TRINITY_DN7799_c0_g5~~TRINITY_DN7799_c0_g5_i1.p1  ORF type:complete len:721 (-),score=173.72 TRINITY_DN7799_c0_g5_i1:204-2366(-)